MRTGLCLLHRPWRTRAWAGCRVPERLSSWCPLRLPRRYEQGLDRGSDRPLQVVHRAAGESHARRIDGGVRVEAHPLAPGRALEVEGEVGIDEHVARPVEG